MIYIGDTVIDSKACKNANIDFALALWGVDYENIEANYYLKTPMDILSIALGE